MTKYILTSVLAVGLLAAPLAYAQTSPGNGAGAPGTAATTGESTTDAPAKGEPMTSTDAECAQQKTDKCPAKQQQ